MLRRGLGRFWRESRGEGTATQAIWMAVGSVVSLAVLGVVGRAVFAYFQHFASCLNGC